MSTIGLGLRSNIGHSAVPKIWLRRGGEGAVRGQWGRGLRAYATAGVVLLGATLVVATATVPGTDGIQTHTVRLAASDALQPLIDQLLQTHQQILDANGAYPFITAFDQTTLPQYVQTLGVVALQNELGTLNMNNSYDPLFFAPTGWNAPDADAFYLNAPAADKQYLLYYAGDQQTFTMTVHPGPGTQDMTFRPQTLDFHVPHAYSLAQFTPNADGSYTIVMSPTEHSGNWIDTSGSADTMITSDLGDWGLPHSTFTMDSDAQTAFVLPVLSEDQISSVLSNVITNMTEVNGAPVNHGIQQALNSLPENIFSPIAPTSAALGPVLPGQLTSFSHFALEPDQALVVKVPDVDSIYWSMQAFNAWAVNLPATTATGSLNDVQSFHDPDGYTYYVVSSQDPGVANWIDTSGNDDGILAVRWQGATGTVPSTPVQAEVVNVADVKNEIGNLLPADTPLVTADERADDLQERMFEYDYARDQSYTSGWVTNNLEIDQLKAAMGTDQFSAAFGGQADVPSVLDRMTDPALVPNLATVANEMLANPQGALTAMVQNFPLLVKDIQLPMVLAALRLDLLLGHAPEASTLDTILNQTFIDPATSITAGFMNARDDLAVSLMNADSYSPTSFSDFASSWDELAQFEQSVSQMLWAGLEYAFGAPNAIASALDPADLAALGADLAGA